MVKVMWLGEDTETMPGPSFTTCYGLKFPKDVPVEVTDSDALRRARGNLQFKVIEQEGSHGESQTQGEVKSEDKVKEEKDYDYREKEKGSGYSPVKKKVRKKKPPAQDSSDAAARVSTPDP